mmetsp:Transcript_12579/g.20760  ORF Transcript_12579/g.20760 Transcript_12579/m.20760 type:complete len:673 (-) Transcript_12579:21-2039(-)
MDSSDVDANLHELRKQVNIEDTLRSIASWSEAEASVSPPSTAKLLQAKRAGRASVNAAKQEETSSIQPHSPQASPPLRRSAAVDGSRSAPNVRADPRSNDCEKAGSVCDSHGNEETNPNSSTRAFNKMHAVSKRNDLLISRKKCAAEQQETNGRRMLRAKIANILLEVRRRQFLREQQEKKRKFREDRFERGQGPQALLGDTTDTAFGLFCLARDDDETLSSESKATIYRRSALLDALTLPELVMVRNAPEWFFSGSALAAAVLSHPSPSQREGHSPGTFQSSAKSTMLSGSGSISVSNPREFEDLIDFFSVTESEKDMEAGLYARKLRAQVTDVDGRRHIPGMSEVVDLRETLCRSAERSTEQEPVISNNTPAPPLEMMPCLGRHPHIRYDEESPTLMKVREVYKRKDEQDEQWVDERREAIARRIALNSFKAREQQRELLLQDFKQKELHKLRMLSAEEKKSSMNAEEQELAEQQSISRIRRVYYAVEKSEQAIEDKRDQVSQSLEEWRARVAAASHNMRKWEWEKMKIGERRQQKYMEKLNAIGERRQVTVVSQSRKNDELKKRIQTSLSRQLVEQRLQDSLTFAEELQAKQEAAEVRRQRAKLGHRYGFTERAFGEDALCFDAKHHMVAVDRRGESWQQTAEAWNKLKGSFSVPEICAPRPLSPGGGL